MKNFIQEGERINYTIPAATTIASGDVVVIGNLAGIAVTGGTTGDTIAVALEGVYQLPKPTDLAVTQGDRVYWDTATKRVTKTTTHKPLGTAFASAASSAATVNVRISEDGSAAPVAANVAQNATANGSDAATTQALANSLKTTVNGILTALKNAGLMAPDA